MLLAWGGVGWLVPEGAAGAAQQSWGGQRSGHRSHCQHPAEAPSAEAARLTLLLLRRHV